MPITRKFLGFQRPALQAAAEYLFDRYSHGRDADMSGAIVVLPGSRAGRRLLEILVEGAERKAAFLTPPAIETVGHLPERLYRPKRPFAATLAQQLAWADVLRHADPVQLRQLVASPPEAADDAGWLDLGQMLSRLHTELAADQLDFADVLRHGQQLESFGEAARWQALGALQQAYLSRLDELQVWDMQTARLKAIEFGECRTDKEVILLGAVDMTITLRSMLDQVADQVTVLVFAPSEWSSRFDGYGCLTPKIWEHAFLRIPDQRVHLVDGPSEQAQMVVRRLAEYQGRFRADEITVGLADEKLTLHVQRQLRQCGIASRSAAGVPLTASAPYRLLAAVQDYLRTGRYGEFAALVRHPQVDAWLERRQPQRGWLEHLDRYYSDHLQAQLGGQWLSDAEGTRAVQRVYRRLEQALKPLRGDEQPLDRWGEPLRQLLGEFYGHRSWDRDDPHDRGVLQALEQINQQLLVHEEQIPGPLMPALDAADALQLILRQLHSATTATPADPEAIELLGWLELPLDDAPALVVCSFNEGYAPSSENSDLFLPDSLRSRLGLQDNTRRYARDAYALSTLLVARDSIDLIVGRRNADGDPLTPSRLLFATDRDTMARRAQRFFAVPESERDAVPLVGQLQPGRRHAEFPIPLPEPLSEPIRQLSVTAFRDYLACPYRFYLRRVMKLQTVDDTAEELDGALFGTLLHEALRQFGEGPCRDSTNSREIREFLNQALTDIAARKYGRQALASVLVQLEQMRLRLDAFAQKQAEWAGVWRIEFTEVPHDDQQQTSLDVDGQPLVLRGRIDRIDAHRETGQRVLLDYKSADSLKTPEKVHQRSGQWVDLQLPLYRHLAGSLGLSGPLRLGYVVLPKDVTQVDFCLAEWTDDQLAEADEVAREVVRNIRAERFWPPVDPPPDFFEEFAAICQDRVFEKTGNSPDQTA
jgi:RecB family exonuclease